jgi:hypothetical protein
MDRAQRFLLVNPLLRACTMKPIVLEFIGGYWDGKTVRSDSLEQEEALVAAGCYEMSHHGAIGQECLGLSPELIAFARHHGWQAARNARRHGAHRYVVAEHRETENEIVVTFKYDPTRDS